MGRASLAMKIQFWKNRIAHYLLHLSSVIPLAFLVSSYGYGAEAYVSKSGSPWVAKLVPADRLNEGIPGFEWSRATLEGLDVKSIGTPSEPRGVVRVSGNFGDIRSTLLIGKKILVHAMGEERGFHEDLEIKGPETRIRLLSVDAYGKVKFENATIHFDRWPKFAARGRESEKKERKSVIVPSLGLTHLTYKQSLVQDLAQTSLTFKVAYNTSLSSASKWELGLTGFGTVIPLSSNLQGVSLRTLGLNARVGRPVLGLSSPWRLRFFGGGYYTTTTAQGENFGYSNLFGLQFYPVLSRVLNNGNMASVYLKYAAINDEARIFSKLSNREIAAGFSYLFMKGSLSRISLSLDWAQLQARVQTWDISAMSTSLSIGYSF